jgi:hypothetical protein
LSKRTGGPSATYGPRKQTQTFVGPVDDPLLRGATPYVPFRLCKPRSQHTGILTRLSTRWYRHWETKVLPLPVPYIDHVGKFTIHQLGMWWATPEQWFASVAATVSDRLFRLYCRRNSYRYVKRQTRELVTRIAVLYTATHSNYVLDRLIANLKPDRLKVCEKLLCYFVCRLGTNFRFVYSQTCFQVSWLSFRSKWIRDKPNETSKMLSTLSLSSPRARGKKHRFLLGNPFLFTLDYTRVWRGENLLV